LKSLPGKIDIKNLYRVDMIGFSTIQKALIAFQNDDQDELFNHYDDRNKKRLRKLNINLTDTEQQSFFLKDLSQKLLHVINLAFNSKAAAGGKKRKGSSAGGNGNDDTTSNSKRNNS
jgi:hypothetical protein